jgi:hypothetical protein
MDFKLTEKGTAYWLRPDLGLDPEDVKIEGKKIVVTIHSIGAVDAPASRIVVRDASEKIVGQARVPALKAPTDLQPKTAIVAVDVPLDREALKGATIEIVSSGRLPEITTINNKVILGDVKATSDH